jgi:pantoate--beta-alanine ligase
MKIIEKIKEMQDISEKFRRDGKVISFVPTMGYLHKGHLELIKEGRKRGDILVVSIFVNPTQFGKGEDYEIYPRDLKGDAEKCELAGVDIIFAPSTSEMYPSKYQTFVNVEKVTKDLCGKSRPNHFMGVATVVTKLFNIVKPHIAIFGEKDYQQLLTIRQMVRDLNLDIEVIGYPIVREEDGLAMSSRNSYLTAKERESALSLYKSLKKGISLLESGIKDASIIIDEMRKIIEKEKLAEIDYIKICRPDTLEELDIVNKEAIIAVAVRIGKTRLIDNIIFKGD